jgi:hypothetical protein
VSNDDIITALTGEFRVGQRVRWRKHWVGRGDGMYLDGGVGRITTIGGKLCRVQPDDGGRTVVVDTALLVPVSSDDGR